MSLPNIEKYWFNPDLRTIEEITDFLRTKGLNHAHPYQESGKSYLIILTIKGVIHHDISNINKSNFLSSAKISELSDITTNYCSKFIELHGIQSYNIQYTKPGDIINLPLSNDIMTFIATDKHDSNFFDFTAYINNKVLTYGTRNVDDLIHSGDVGKLLHHIKGFNNVSNGTHIVLAVVGYNKKFLRSFINQQPVVYLVDHTEQTIFIVPCPLDQATISDSTLSGIVYAIKNERTLDCVILNSPIKVNDVNTGDLSPRTLSCIQDAIIQGRNILQNQVVELITILETPLDIDISKMTPFKIQDPLNYSIPYFVQSGIKKFCNFEKPIYFGQGFSHVSENLDVVLPHIFGTISNISACSLGKNSKIDFDVKSLINNNLSIVEVNDKWLDITPLSCLTTGNCIMIITPSEIGSVDDIQKFINNLCVNATCMAGPNSIVLVNVDDKLYWYRGVRIQGLISNVPNYCDNVTGMFTQEILDSWFLSNTKLSWPLTQSKENRSVFWRDEMVAISRCLNDLSGMSLHDIYENTDDIIDLLTQISIILEPVEIRDLRRQIDKNINDMQNEFIRPFQDEYYNSIQSVYSAGEKTDLHKAGATFHKKRQEGIKMSQQVSNALQNLVSKRGVSNNNQSIKQRIRETAISNNVDSSKTMTINDKVDLFEKTCGKVGLLMIDININNMKLSLQEISKSGFNNYIESGNWSNSLAIIDSRFGCLDTITFGSLIEITQSMTNHLLYSVNSITIPKDNNSTASLLPIPILDFAVDLKDPSMINWVEITNEQMFAMSRIWFRGTFSNCVSSREYNIELQSNDLGFFLIHLYLCVAENIVGNISNSCSIDFDSTTSQIIRGLFCQILATCASTKNVLCSVYQIVYNNSKLDILPENQSWILSRMVKIFKYTCWDTENFNINVKKYTIKTIQKYVTNGPCQKMQKYVSETKKIQNVKSSEWLGFLRLLVDILFNTAKNMIDNNINIEKDVATRLMSFKPTSISNGTGMIVHNLKKMIEDVETDWNLEFIQIINISLFSYVKHSDNLDGSKKEIRNEIHNCNNLIDNVNCYKKIEKDEWKSSDDHNHKINIEKILHGFDCKFELEDIKTSLIEIKCEDETNLMKLEKLKGSDDAVNLLKILHLVKCDNLDIPRKSFRSLLDYLMIEDHDSFVRKIIENQLILWQDPIAAIDGTINVLFNH